ncbi:MAG: hypothetical protein P8X81_06265 [Woeseiaceae bacterium]|jgi:hypothetical protein
MIKMFFASITRNAISLAGTALAIASLILIVCLFLIQQMGYEGGPYLGILTFLVLPGLAIIGLILIPIGSFLWRRKVRQTPDGQDVAPLPVFDLNKESTRKWALIFSAITVFNVIILSGATYKGIHYMESVEFCGMACHSVMEPEHTAHALGPHSRVPCAGCHIGPGADWFVKSKLDGAWQLVSVNLGLYPKPIPTPLHDLRPARDTCEQCHWPTKFVGDKLKVIKHYKEDEANTELTTALLIKVGGEGLNHSTGIHWHVDPNIEIRYRSDETREDVYEVEFTDAEGQIKHYADRRAPEDGGMWRTMDCVDCHNRPAHQYKSAGPEIDRAITDGAIDRSLPFVKRESLRIIQENYPSHEEARAVITEELTKFYAENYPDVATSQADTIAAAAVALGDIYASNVFPTMEVWWDTYPNHIGHEQSAGCERCHTRGMRTAERENINNDCDTCHIVLAEGEEEPDILSALDGE